MWLIPNSQKILHCSLPLWNDTWITTDVTIYQREILSSMEKERDHMNSASGEITWFIKFFHQRWTKKSS